MKLKPWIGPASKGYSFWCPGCKERHSINTEGSGPNWTVHGADSDTPTIEPSILVRSGHFASHYSKEKTGCWCTYYEEHPDEERDFECKQCHSFVRNGAIQFLSDSSHGLAGQTVTLLDIPYASSSEDTSSPL